MRRRDFIAALAAQADGPLDKTFDALEQRSGGTLGVAATHLESNRVITWRERERFPMMSVAKLPAAMRVFVSIEAGLLGLHQMMQIPPPRPDAGYSPMREHYPDGLVCTLEQLLIWSLRDSDNAAHDFLIGLVGGPDQVQKMLEHETGAGIRFDRTERDAIADMKKYGPRGFVQQGLDTSTPEAMTQLVSRIQRRQTLRPAACDYLIRWLSESKTGARRIRALLPAGALVWDKTGTAATEAGVHICTNDAGVISMTDNRGHIAISLFLKLAKVELAATERVLAEAAAAVYMFFERSE